MGSVFLACPRYGQVEFETALGMVQSTRTHDLTARPLEFSLLAYNFNRLWAEALNRREELGLTHFAMMHADVIPAPFWVDTLIEEMERTGVDLLSTVIPIKNDKGRTSTGIYHPGGIVRRLTMTEVFALPETFTISDTDSPDKILAVNTGLWVCDFRKPWVEEVYFHIQDAIVKAPDGKFQARVMPEDWHFSIQLAQLGVPYAATRKVTVGHVGRQIWRNDHVYGEATDTGD